MTIICTVLEIIFGIIFGVILIAEFAGMAFCALILINEILLFVKHVLSGEPDH